MKTFRCIFQKFDGKIIYFWSFEKTLQTLGKFGVRKIIKRIPDQRSTCFQLVVVFFISNSRWILHEFGSFQGAQLSTISSFSTFGSYSFFILCVYFIYTDSMNERTDVLLLPCLPSFMPMPMHISIQAFILHCCLVFGILWHTEYIIFGIFFGSFDSQADESTPMRFFCRCVMSPLAFLFRLDVSFSFDGAKAKDSFRVYVFITLFSLAFVFDQNSIFMVWYVRKHSVCYVLCLGNGMGALVESAHDEWLVIPIV